MTKKELAQKVKTILQTVAGIIILGCVGATWQYFNQPTIEEVIDEKIVEIKEENDKFVDEVEAKQKLLRIDDSLGRKQEKAIKALRKSRDNKKTDNALSKLQAAADTDQNLMPFIVNSVKTYATTGEISNTLREVFGEYRPKEVF